MDSFMSNLTQYREIGDVNITRRNTRSRRSIMLSASFEYTQGDLRDLGSTMLEGNLLDVSETLADDYLTEVFFEILQCHAGSYNALEIVKQFAECLHYSKGNQNEESEISYIVEANTWRLLHILYQDRFLTQRLMDDDGLDQYFGKSEKLCAENLYKRDGLVRESQLVIDWLESCAAQRDEDVAFFTTNSVGWENTLHQLQSADTIAFKSSRPIVKEMHPDAPYCEKRPLHDLDQEDDKMLAQKVFRKIRSGKLDEAQKLCRESGHSWKAALFEGWRLYHDPNQKDEITLQNLELEPEEMNCVLKEIEGNESRDLWKLMAIKYCKQDCLNVHDKASIASFCGYLKALLPVCDNWEDNLWAYMKTMVDVRVESEIRDCVMRNRECMALPEEYWTQRMSINEVFSSLESSKNDVARRESSKIGYVIQKHIILDDIPSLMLKLEEWIEDPAIPPSFLRYFAHLVLFFDQTAQSHDKTISEKVVEMYVKRLMKMKETKLVAYYTSKVSPQNQIYLYASYLATIFDNDERKMSLKYAEDCDLDVLAVTKQVVEDIRKIPYDIEEDPNLEHKTTQLDLNKISALDWIIFYEEHRVEVLIQSNALIFTFLTLRKVDAAQQTLNKIPSDTVKIILSEGTVDEKYNQIIKEHLSYKAYLEAIECFNEWFKHFNGKPQPPESLPKNATFPQKVAHEHKESQYEAELERWKLSYDYLVKKAKSSLYNVLLFPEGWLTGAKDDDYLRSTCIPEVVLLLYSILYNSGKYEECVQLADILAAKKHELYKVYSKEKLREILAKLSESSVALLNAKKDPWGNETSA